ncbi:protein argonaute 4-like [Trifolium pratense]|uniref:Protein argonaute 4-like n=1 Tax=Trifolium pratense TaxID=57577 RepID=A0A2K3NUL9_TRIPR|nr:protein argonaute 4-like [Trifolium pratense]
MSQLSSTHWYLFNGIPKPFPLFKGHPLVEKSRQKPQECMKVLSDALRTSNYGSEPMLHNYDISNTGKFALSMMKRFVNSYQRKNSDLYGPWKKKCRADFGIVIQCIAPTRVNDQYLRNVLLKINAKLGGMNSLLGVEHWPFIPIVSRAPTLIMGMDVSHGSPGQTDQ